jgi:hypothetical protein
METKAALRKDNRRFPSSTRSCPVESKVTCPEAAETPEAKSANQAKTRIRPLM